MRVRQLEVTALLSVAVSCFFGKPLSAQPTYPAAWASGPAPVFEISSVAELAGAPLSGKKLLDSIHAVAERGHRPLTYGGAKAVMFARADNVIYQGANGVFAAYSGVFVLGSSPNGGDYPERGDINGDGYVDSGGMNAEHVWPQSFFKQRSPMRSDLHNLLPTFMKPNSVRGRLPFATVPADAADYRTVEGARRGGGRFEPPDSAKGRVARAMLYFYTRYLGVNVIPSAFVDEFWNSKIETLLEWNRVFPPTDFERIRNDLVEKAQGNRNPFVDHPELADQIGEEAFRMTPSRRLYSAAGR